VIVAAGLTPAWQQIMRYECLRLGEVNRAAEVHWCASGKNLNVGSALAGLGAASLTLSPLGGRVGQDIAADFLRRGLSARWTSSQKPTRICTTLLDEATGRTTELVENAGALTADELAEFSAAYHASAASAEVVVLTGSLPQGTPVSFYRDLVKETPCPVVLDARGPEMLAALECGPQVVKPNRDELGATLGRTLQEADLVAAMRELCRRGALAVVVTQGKQAVWVVAGAQSWRLEPPAVTPLVNPIGSGDCLAAGLAVGLSRGLPLLDAVRYGMAAAADNVTQLLPARVEPRRVDTWLDKIVGSSEH
jgi:tagatose 6-phosphate kinase